MKRALALALLLVAATAAARSPKRRAHPGRVVRVERTPPPYANAHICTSAEPDGKSWCFGSKPQVGDQGAVLDLDGPHGRERLTEVKAEFDPCQNENSWRAVGESTADISQINSSYAVVLLDAYPSSKAHTIDSATITMPTHYLGETYMTIVDDDGDGRPEFAISYYYCMLEDGHAVAQGQGETAFCLVYYLGSAGDLREQKVEIVKSCY